MGRTDEITRELKALTTNTADIAAAALVDNDGLMMASAMPQELDEDSVAAMSAAMLGIGERITSEMNQGEFEMVMLRAKEGYTVLVRCGDDAVLTVLAVKKAKLGLIFLDVKRTAKDLARLLG